MADLVVTVPKDRWLHWLSEGDIAGAAWTGRYYEFGMRTNSVPSVMAGERVYVVAHGKVRGWAPLVEIDIRPVPGSSLYDVKLIRAGDAHAVSVVCMGMLCKTKGTPGNLCGLLEPHPMEIQGFRGWRYRWWTRDAEHRWPGWIAP